MVKNRLAIITAIFGDYDGLKDPKDVPKNVDFICFSDIERHSNVWKIVQTPYHLQIPNHDVFNSIYSKNERRSNMMRAKFYKIQMCKIDILKDYDYLMWVDGSFKLNSCDFVSISDDFLSQNDIALFHHSVRNNIEDEVYYCENNTIDYIRDRYHDQNMYFQSLRYIEKGMNISRSGLYELGIVLIRNIPKIRELMDLWWFENQHQTFQDQISMPYCLWSKGITPKVISNNIYNNVFAVHKGHKKTVSSIIRPHNNKQIQSFDCFDTIAIRLNRDPSAIFKRMERRTSKVGFAKARMKAERDGATMDVIYSNLVQDGFFTKVESDRWLTYEYFTEMSGMTRNNLIIKHWRESDIIVSDMYWSVKQLRHLFNRMNMNPSHIFVSTAGKSNGTVWNEQVFKIVAKSMIESHIGDNVHSDCRQARKYVRNAFHYGEADHTAKGKYLVESGMGYTAGIARQTRLQNPFVENSTNYKMWNVYCDSWFPSLVILSRQLKDTFDKFKAKRIIFLSRDMYLTWQVFKVLYPTIDSDYVMFSRIAARDPNPLFLEYFRSKCDSKTLVIDLQGTGNTFYKFRTQYNIDCLKFVTCFSGKGHEANENYVLDFMFNEFIEKMNYSVHGSFVGFGKDLSEKQVLKLEYDEEIVQTYINALFQCVHRLRMVSQDLLFEDVYDPKKFGHYIRKLWYFKRYERDGMKFGHVHHHEDVDRQTLSPDFMLQILYSSHDTSEEIIGRQSLDNAPEMYHVRAYEQKISPWTWLGPVVGLIVILCVLIIMYNVTGDKYVNVNNEVKARKRKTSNVYFNAHYRNVTTI